MPQLSDLPQEIQSGYNASGSTIPRGRAVRRSGAGTDQIALPAAGTDPILGITLNDIPNLSYGPIAVGGQAIAVVGAATAAGARLEANTAGKLITRTTGSMVGIGNTVTSALDQEVMVMLTGPGAV